MEICGIFELIFFLDDTPLIILSLLSSLLPLFMALHVLAVPLFSSFLLKYLYNVIMVSPLAIYDNNMSDAHDNFCLTSLSCDSCLSHAF
jgi:hypothetical protein